MKPNQIPTVFVPLSLNIPRPKQHFFELEKQHDHSNSLTQSTTIRILYQLLKIPPCDRTYTTSTTIENHDQNHPPLNFDFEQIEAGTRWQQIVLYFQVLIYGYKEIERKTCEVIGLNQRIRIIWDCDIRFKNDMGEYIFLAE